MKTISAALLLTAVAGTAHAENALGLTGDRMLVTIDTATGAVTRSVEAQGVTRLHGIDLRPATGKVVGLTDALALVEIDPATGATVEVAKLATPITFAENAPVIVDVNPAADKLRIISGTANYRIDMATGDVTNDLALAFDAGDANAGATPMVVAVAYSNSYGKPEKTGMFDIDAGLDALLRQTKPNEGVLVTLGPLGVALDGPVAFDIATDAAGTNTGWVAALGGLHNIDLETGAISATMPVSGTDQPVRDLTVLPAM